MKINYARFCGFEREIRGFFGNLGNFRHINCSVVTVLQAEPSSTFAAKSGAKGARRKVALNFLVR